MSIRDADLCEVLLHRVSARSCALSVLEWGSGRSTLWYPTYLQRLGHDVSWVSVEHDSGFFDEALRDALAASGAEIVRLGHGGRGAPSMGRVERRAGVTAFVFDGGEVRPDLPGRELDRDVNLDAYVALPGLLGRSFDIVLVDGRKRRRCLLEAARLVSPNGYVVLHDAWRRHYQCAWSAYGSGRRFGDECWIGATGATDFTDVLPWHAFERHEEDAAIGR